jgi:hypothetical protein
LDQWAGLTEQSQAVLQMTNPVYNKKNIQVNVKWRLVDKPRSFALLLYLNRQWPELAKARPYRR